MKLKRARHRSLWKMLSLCVDSFSSFSSSLTCTLCTSSPPRPQRHRPLAESESVLEEASTRPSREAAQLKLVVAAVVVLRSCCCMASARCCRLERNSDIASAAVVLDWVQGALSFLPSEQQKKKQTKEERERERKVFLSPLENIGENEFAQ